MTHQDPPSPPQDPLSPPRRAFLRGAGLLALSALGLRAALPADAGSNLAGKTSLAFWFGSSFAPADALPPQADSRAGTTVQVTIHGHFVPPAAPSARLHAIQAHFAVESAGHTTHAPFLAWTANRHNPRMASFPMPVHPAQGLRFSSEWDGATRWEEPHALAPCLRLGTYVIAAGRPDWRGCRLADGDQGATIVRDTVLGPVPAGFEYALLTIRQE